MPLITGTTSADTLTGGSGADTILGDDGNDSLFGGDGVDSIHGEAGDDTLRGGAGDDAFIWGGSGNDVFLYNVGDGLDRVYEQRFSQDANAGSADRLIFGTGIDLDDLWLTVRTEDGIYFDTLNLRIRDGDTAYDSLDGVISENQAHGQARIETVEFADGTILDINTTDRAAYAIVGAAAAVSQTGTSGDDAFGGYNNALDTLDGAAGNDTLNGYGADDSLVGGAGDDSLMGDDGNDTLVGGADADTLLGGIGNDSLFGGDGVDSLYGGLGDDTLRGGAGDEGPWLQGREGNDTYVYHLGDGLDRLWERAEWGTEDTILFGPGIGLDDLVFRYVNEGPGLENLEILIKDGTTPVDNLDGIISESQLNFNNIARIEYVRLDNGLLIDVSGNAISDYRVIEGLDGSPINRVLANEAPEASVNTGASVAVSQSLQITGSMIDFTDADGDALFYTITNIPTGATLSNDGVTVVVGDQITEAEIAAGDISITPTLAGDQDLEFTVSDNLEVLDNQSFTVSAFNSYTGTSGNDTLTGSSSNDALDGQGGDDTLSGGDGDDTLTGGLGNDQFTGGAGADIFITDTTSGLDIITDLEIASDIIRLVDNTGSMIAENRVSLAQNGSDIDVQVDGSAVLTLLGETSTTIGDYLFDLS